jgi:thioredoxin-related protein
MKQLLVSIMLFFTFLVGYAQDMKKFSLYKPEENAAVELEKAVKEAKASGKHVFVQIGGNWCVWCARFYEYVNNDKQLDSAMHADYIVYHVNYSKENINKEMMAKLGYPQRFGFPVFVVLDGKGNRIHTQNSAYLEQDKSYNKAKVLEFFNNWNPKSLQPEQYKNY